MNNELLCLYIKTTKYTASLKDCLSLAKLRALLKSNIFT